MQLLHLTGGNGLIAGIVWSFRFPSIGSLSRRSKASLSQPVARPHIDTQRWLSVLDLDQYGELFSKFDGVEVGGGHFCCSV